MKHLNRWIYAIVGTMVLLLAGLVYAWSIFSRPIGREFPQWSVGNLSMVFTVCLFCFCAGGLLAGILSTKGWNFRNLLLSSAALFLGGFYLASRTYSLPGLLVSYGLICGLASGIAYNSVISTVSKWFGDKQGLISGILLMGFGFGSFLIGKVYTAFTPADLGGWRRSFLVMGLVIGLVFFLGSMIIVPPDEAEAKRYAKVTKSGGETFSYTTKQMLADRNFWFYLVWVIALSAAGVILIGHASGIALQANSDLDANSLATIVGLIAIFNGIGRVIFGGMYDQLGRAKTMNVINGAWLLAISITLAALLVKNGWLLIAGFIASGIAYGGVTPTNSAFIANFYGPKHFAMNFPIINTGLMVASFAPSLAGWLFDKTKTYTTSLYLIYGLIALALVAGLFIKKMPTPPKSDSGYGLP